MGSNFKELVARISTVKTYLNSDMRFENCGFLNIRRCKLKTHVIIPYRHAMRSREPHLREVKKISCGDRSTSCRGRTSCCLFSQSILTNGTDILGTT